MADANGSSRWTDALLDRKRQVCDPVADEPVAAVFGSGGVDAVNAVMKTLVRTDQRIPEELPEVIKDYLSTTHPLPEWHDKGKIEQGQRLFQRWGLHISCCLFCASLPSSYAAAKGVMVLASTGRLETDARRRVMETGQFLIDVLDVGGLEEHGKGRRSIQKVRLMHAAVRHLIYGEPERWKWDFDWGKPINQEDLAGTLLAFSYIVTDPIGKLGVDLSAEEIDAYLHLWNVIGHLLGVCDDLLADDIDDATELVDAIRRRQFKESPEGQIMTAALLQLLDEMTPGHVFDDTIPPLIRHLIGDETADMIGVPKSDLSLLVRAVNRLLRLLRLTELESPLEKLMSQLPGFEGELVKEWLRLERGGDRAPFDMPGHLARSWLIPPDMAAGPGPVR